MTKVHGKRYAYKFDFHALMQACSSQSTDAPNYKYQADLSGLLASPYPQASKLNGLFSQPNHFSSSFHQQSIFTPGTAYWNTNSVMSAGNIQNIYASNMDLAAANKESQAAQGPFVQPPTSSIHSSLPCTKFSDFKDFHSHLGKDLSPCIPSQIGSSASAVAAHRNASLNRYPYLSHWVNRTVEATKADHDLGRKHCYIFLGVHTTSPTISFLFKFNFHTQK